MSLAYQFNAYNQWRNQLAKVIQRFRYWLIDQELCDPHSESRLSNLLDHLKEDRLRIAFVAEFSRGKSELINAIFFADYGHRILPSSAGRTTMCPTELLYNPAKPACIELLPIHTRQQDISLSQYRRIPNEWQRIALDISSANAMKTAIRQVSEVIRVPPEEARNLGFSVDENNPLSFHTEANGLVEIPRWRHALINFPHPLLAQGLEILDTPGLNAIGAEPELTLSLLPNAHAALFLLSADTGVTQSDLMIWQKHVNPDNKQRGYLVALNKIDTLWDVLKSEEETSAEIAGQVKSCANILHLEEGMIFPISAQKGLVAKINQDTNLLEKSRLLELENALYEKIIPARQDIARDYTEREFSRTHAHIQDILESRQESMVEQQLEMMELRGKNKNMVNFMMQKARKEREEFEEGLQRYYATRTIFTKLSNQLLGYLSLPALQTQIDDIRNAMLKASFSRGLSKMMDEFFIAAYERLEKSDKELEDIHKMMSEAYRRLIVGYGIKLSAPPTFSMYRYEKEVTRLKTWCDTHLNTLFNLLTNEKRFLTRKFFTEIAHQIYWTFEQAAHDTENWLKTIMIPIETQASEHRQHLKRRVENIRRILRASDTLEERLSELETTKQRLQQQLRALNKVKQTFQERLWYQPPQKDAPEAMAAYLAP